MAEQITQRELRNNSGRIMRELGAGHSFVVTQRHEPVGELRPLRRKRIVAASAVVEAFADAPVIESGRFRSDVDGIIDQDVEPYA